MHVVTIVTLIGSTELMAMIHEDRAAAYAWFKRSYLAGTRITIAMAPIPSATIVMLWYKK